MKHYYKFVSLKTSIVISVLLLAAVCYGNYMSAKTYNLFVNYKQQQHNRQVIKVKLFYMEHCEKIWEELAEYEAEATIAAAERYEIPLHRLVGVVVKESEGYPFAVSRTGALGLAQIDFQAHDDTFPGLKETRDKYDPKYNISAAAYLLRQYTKKYGYEHGLMAYNLGEGAYAKGQRTEKYVKAVKNISRKFKYFD